MIYNHANDRDLCVCFLLSQIYFVNFLIENYPIIFGEDMPLHYGSSLFCSDGENTYNSLNTLTDNVEMEEQKHEDNPCSSGNTCPTGNDAVPRSNNFTVREL